MKKKKGSHNQLPKESLAPEQSQGFQPKDETQHGISCLSKFWQTAKHPAEAFLRWTWWVLQKAGWVLQVSAIFGIVSFYYEFSPNVSVTPHNGFSTQNPLFIPFIISNNGHLDLRKLEVTCTILEVQLEGGNSFNNVKTVLTDQSNVAAGESLAISCAPRYRTDSPVISATVTINITFEIFPYHYLRNEDRSLRFIAASDKDRKWHWLPQTFERAELLDPKDLRFFK